eukprot:COSAG04_NODE_6_length_47123_cov_87.347482_21_plen_301_part_00
MALEAELQKLKLGGLSSKAVAMGIDPDDVADAQDQDEPSDAVRSLITECERLRVQLAQLKLGALSRRAAEVGGVDSAKLEEAQDQDDPKQAVLDLVIRSGIECARAVNRWKPPAATSSAAPDPAPPACSLTEGSSAPPDPGSMAYVPPTIGHAGAQHTDAMLQPAIKVQFASESPLATVMQPRSPPRSPPGLPMPAASLPALRMPISAPQESGESIPAATAAAQPLANSPELVDSQGDSGAHVGPQTGGARKRRRLSDDEPGLEPGPPATYPHARCVCPSFPTPTCRLTRCHLPGLEALP